MYEIWGYFIQNVYKTGGCFIHDIVKVQLVAW